MNIQPYIILNNKDSRSITGLLITSLPPITKPQVRTQIETVDGRSGDIVTPLGFEAYDKPLGIGLTYDYDIDEIIEFFNSSGVVTFSNEPDKYYRYAIYEKIDFEKLIRFKTAEVVLHVQPYKFSTTEEPELFDLSSGVDVDITNSGNTDSRPDLLIIGSGDIDVSLNDSQILSLELGEEAQPIIISSEDMNAYGAQSAIQEVKAEIVPYQDLHGYSQPWSAGAGANKWNENWKIITQSGQDWFTNSTPIPVLPNTTYYFKAPYSASVDSVDEDGNYKSYLGQFINNTFTTPNDCEYIRFLILVSSYGNTYKNDISINYPSSITTYSPYENICEISGYTELSVTACGVNLWDETWDNCIWDEANNGAKRPSGNSIGSKDYIYIQGLTSLYFKAPETPQQYTYWLLFYDKDKNLISYVRPISSMLLNVPNNAAYCTFYNYLGYGTTYNNDISINYPSSDTDYHAYDGSTYNNELVDENEDPLTVYGGELNLTTGELKITRGKFLFDGTTMNGWSVGGTYGTATRFDYSDSTIKPNTAVLSNYLASGNVGNDREIITTHGSANRIILEIFTSRLNTADIAGFKTYLENNNLEVVFELAEPVTYQLTPTQINNLLGENNLFSDVAGGNISARYKSNGVIHNETALIVSFTVKAEDMERGVLLNRLVTGDYDKIRLKKGENTLSFTGNALQLVIDKYSRWI